MSLTWKLLSEEPAIGPLPGRRILIADLPNHLEWRALEIQDARKTTRLVLRTKSGITLIQAIPRNSRFFKGADEAKIMAAHLTTRFNLGERPAKKKGKKK